MKVCILAGGVGSRLSEETVARPKPMVDIGSKPILWHIMRYYYEFGHDDFYIGLGYKGDYIKRWFFDHAHLSSNLKIRPARGSVESHGSVAEDWTVNLIDTGETTNTGGRIKRLIPHLGPGTFMLTWGDGVGKIDLDALLAFHKSHGKLATLTAVRPPARFGHLDIQGNQIIDFSEKPQAAEGWINGAFFVLEPEVFDYIDGDDTLFEREPLQRLAADGQLMAYHHEDFWACMDTLRDKVMLENLWQTNKAPWRIWE